MDHDRGTIRLVNRELDEVLRGLEEATKFAESFHFELDEWYLSAIAQLESHPTNQPGADKAWVARTLASFRRHYLIVRTRSTLA